MDFTERLEYLDNHSWEKDQYMKLILDILYDNGTSKEDTDLIQNAIYSYESAR